MSSGSTPRAGTERAMMTTPPSQPPGGRAPSKPTNQRYDQPPRHRVRASRPKMHSGMPLMAAANPGYQPGMSTESPNIPPPLLPPLPPYPTSPSFHPPPSAGEQQQQQQLQQGQASQGRPEQPGQGGQMASRQDVVSLVMKDSYMGDEQYYYPIPEYQSFKPPGGSFSAREGRGGRKPEYHPLPSVMAWVRGIQEKAGRMKAPGFDRGSMPRPVKHIQFPVPSYYPREPPYTDPGSPSSYVHPGGIGETSSYPHFFNEFPIDSYLNERHYEQEAGRVPMSRGRDQPKTARRPGLSRQRKLRYQSDNRSRGLDSRQARKARAMGAGVSCNTKDNFLRSLRQGLIPDNPSTLEELANAREKAREIEEAMVHQKQYNLQIQHRDLERSLALEAIKKVEIDEVNKLFQKAMPRNTSDRKRLGLNGENT